jgi:hypothetical protein
LKLRKIISLTLVFSFILLLLTGIILYIVPPGRIAYWAGWKLIGLSKDQWANIHLTSGIMGLAAAIFHIYFNWKPIIYYLRDKKRELPIFSINFNFALLIVLLFTIGTLLKIPPFSWVLNLNEAIKNSATVEFGEPPYSHAELSTFKQFAEKMQINIEQGIEKLKTEGIKIEAKNEILLDIAKRNKLSPQQIYNSLKELNVNKKLVFPNAPSPGTGRKTIRILCDQYNLDQFALIEYLGQQEIKAEPDMALKTIAENHQKQTIEIFDLIKQFTQK